VLASFPDGTVSAVARADRIASGVYDLLGYEGLRFQNGADIDWHLDPVSGRRPPRAFQADVPYLDPAIGDHKVIWELNRHQEWLQLGRAWWLTGEARFRRTFVRQLESWLQANPPADGINWASALELSLRSLSWLWALELFAAEEPDDDSPWTVDLLLGLDEQLRHVERRLSRFFSPNTHLLGEALALYVCGRALPELARSARWARIGRDVLLLESTRQILPDGVHAERSTHYHRYALEFYLLALAVARITADGDVQARLRPVVRGLSRFMRDVSDNDGRYPLLGDDDGGELVPVAGRSPGSAAAALAWADALLDRHECAVGPAPEALYWLTAVCGAPREGLPPSQQPSSSAYPAAGYFISRQGRSHLVFDAGAHGFLNGGHAHADALSVTLSIEGQPLLVDSGTLTYTMDPGLRDYFRSSQAHNTVTMDGHSQSQPKGPFQWASAAGAEPGRIVRRSGFDYFEGVTRAYAPLEHHRSVLALDDRLWVVADRIAECAGGQADGRRHAAMLHWHLNPGWQAMADGDGGVRLSCEGRNARLSVPGAQIEIVRGGPDGRTGWISPVYGRAVPTTTLRCHFSHPLPLALATVIAAGDDTKPYSARLATVLGAEGIDDALAVVSEQANAVGVTLFGSRRGEVRTIVGGPGHGPLISTDARLLHVRADAGGRVRRICAVDVSQVRIEGAQTLILHASGPVADIDISISADGAHRVVSSGSVHGVTLTVEHPPSFSSADPSPVAPNLSSARK
jgi:hypothetical protein